MCVHGKVWCPWAGSNCRPLPYQGSALPLSHMGKQSHQSATVKIKLERETGIEPASLAWKARVLPLNYSRKPWFARTAQQYFNLFTFKGGGGNWIRTSVGVSQQIYSLPPLATRASLRRDFYCISVFGCLRNLFQNFFLARLAGIEPTTLGFGGQYSIH